jgi:hypothetical protein
LRLHAHVGAVLLSQDADIRIVQHTLTQKSPEEDAGPVDEPVLVWALLLDLAEEPPQTELNLVTKDDQPGIGF